MTSFFEVHEKCIGKEKMHQLKNSRIAVVGLGGLGCSVAMGLTRLGIQNLVLADNDHIERSNVARQILFTKSHIGASKVQTAKDALLEIFDDLNITCIQDYITTQNGINILKSADIIVDCTDNYIARYAISKTCESINKPMIFGGVQGFEGQVGVFNYKNSKPFHHIFQNINSLLKVENCEASGVLPFVVQTVANYQVIECYKIICNENNVLNNQLLCINTLSNKSRILKLE
ncbi:HesA/MoeB/ThiF family protein [Winogradskyella helgolandensis]|uniref:HesA/MoeB/ThiF family protein n=1 Tax=Winogradskyella helgolandensis TaxID=2697010 RepID=UPI0015CDB89E|nr:HesA/MoeB/ThiF family protein [Winogradskyella helgolandensis]